MYYIDKNNENQFMKFIEDNQELVRNFIIGLADIPNAWFKLQVDNYFMNLRRENRKV